MLCFRWGGPKSLVELMSVGTKAHMGENAQGLAKTRKIKYKSLPSQRLFHGSKARFKGFSGPVGSGKTKALCFEAIRASYKNVGLIGLIGAPTYPMLRDATLTTFAEMCEESGLPFVLNKTSNTVTMRDTGSRILFRSLDEYERVRGTNLAWFGVDEMSYTAEEAWTRLEARLRDPKAKYLCGFGVWTPNGFDWVYRRFRAEPVRGYSLVEAKPFENQHLLDETPDYYERLRESYDENFFRQEALGEYLNLQSGQVYYAFSREAHVGNFEVDPGKELLWSWDFNINPMCSVVCQERGGKIFVVDEIVLRTSSTPEVCAEFFQRYDGHSAGLKLFGDASGGQIHSVTGTSDYDLIRQFLAQNQRLRGELHVGRANPRVRDRVNAVNGQLRNAQGEQRLFVDRKCKELIKDLEQVCYKPDSGQIDKARDSQRTHLSDALGYLLWHRLHGSRPVGERSDRLV